MKLLKVFAKSTKDEGGEGCSENSGKNPVISD